MKKKQLLKIKNQIDWVRILRENSDPELTRLVDEEGKRQKAVRYVLERRKR